MLAAPSIASKRWAFEQYDSIVGSRTARRPESADAAVLAIPEADTAIAVSIDGNGRRVACDPYAGTVEAVLECAQNLACAGAEPLGLTNCLNFGNPEKPVPAWQLDRSVQGAGRRLRGARRAGRRRQRLALQRGPRRPDLPDPGRRHGRRAARAGRGGAERLRRRGRRDLPARAVRTDARRQRAGEAARRAPPGPTPARHSGGRRAPAPRCATRCAPERSPPPTTSATAASPARSPSARSAAGLGCQVDLQHLRERGCSPEEALFGEGSGGFLLSGERERLEALASDGVAVLYLGKVGGDTIEIAAGDRSLSLPLADAETAWRSLGERAAAAS